MTQAAIPLALAALLVGLLAGIALGRRLAARSGAGGRLADQLRSRDQRLQVHERQVAEHFERTAALTEALDQAVGELRGHLAAGAGNLVNAELGRRIAAGAAGTKPSEQDVTPPRDYAPSQGLLRGERPAAERAGKGSPAPLQLVGDEDDPTLKVG